MNAQVSKGMVIEDLPIGNESIILSVPILLENVQQCMDPFFTKESSYSCDYYICHTEDPHSPGKMVRQTKRSPFLQWDALILGYIYLGK